jgi:hypothetical protein
MSDASLTFIKSLPPPLELLPYDGKKDQEGKEQKREEQSRRDQVVQ